MSERAPARALPVPESAGAARALEVCTEKLRAGVSCVLSTVIGRHGSTPSTPGQKLVLAFDEVAVGTVGGGAVEREVLEAMLVLKESGEPHVEIGRAHV